MGTRPASIPRNCGGWREASPLPISKRTAAKQLMSTINSGTRSARRRISRLS
jgi:hypothetical protein